MERIFTNDKSIVIMKNKEKYKFDDFTLENYRRLIGIAIKKSFNFISYTDEYIDDRKDILWRHDVEFEPDIALKMAEIEHDLGVKSTYFFQIHSKYYNIFDGHYTSVLNKIKELGHFIGLHFDSHYYNIIDEKQLNEYIYLDRNYFEKVLKIDIDTFSFHNTTPFTQSCLEYKYGGLINVYSSHFKEKYNYCGDSLGYWRFDRLEDVLNNENIKHLQVLTHDANWSDEVLSPRKRLHKVFFAQAQRLFDEQVEGLHKKGMLCPDDNED